VRFENKNIFFYLQNAPAYYNAGLVAVNFIVAGLAPGMVFSGVLFHHELIATQ
jgi:hypothetical protein